MSEVTHSKNVGIFQNSPLVLEMAESIKQEPMECTISAGGSINEQPPMKKIKQEVLSLSCSQPIFALHFACIHKHCWRDSRYKVTRFSYRKTESTSVNSVGGYILFQKDHKPDIQNSIKISQVIMQYRIVRSDEVYVELRIDFNIKCYQQFLMLLVYLAH